MPGLLALPEDARLLWGDPQARKEAVDALINHSASTGTVKRIDDAVTIGLRALGLRRGPVRDVRVDSIGRNWLGRKADTCDLLFDEMVIRALPEHERADRLFKTWIHESIHARALPGGEQGTERRNFRGFEEGLAEGLTRLVLREKAGMPPLQGAYNYYVEAYRTLATALEVEVEQLWRNCWSYIPGAVRSNFLRAVSDCLGQPLSAKSSAQLRVRADVVFHTQRISDEPDSTILLRAWMDIIKHVD